jgi:hypothetical protein
MYSPKQQPAGLDPKVQPLIDWAASEFQSLARAFGEKIDRIRFNPLGKAPDRLRTGDVIFADGSAYDPGDGIGIYEFNGTALKKVGPPLTGRTTLVGGTKTVSLASVTANTNIFVFCQVPGGTPGWLQVSARVVSTSFTILSSNAADTSTVAYMVIEP